MKRLNELDFEFHLHLIFDTHSLKTVFYNLIGILRNVSGFFFDIRLSPRASSSQLRVTLADSSKSLNLERALAF